MTEDEKQTNPLLPDGHASTGGVTFGNGSEASEPSGPAETFGPHGGESTFTAAVSKVSAPSTVSAHMAIKGVAAFAAVGTVSGVTASEVLRRLEELRNLVVQAEPAAAALDARRAILGGNRPEGAAANDDLPEFSSRHLSDAIHALNILRDEVSVTRPVEPDSHALAVSALEQLEKALRGLQGWFIDVGKITAAHILGTAVYENFHQIMIGMGELLVWILKSL